MKPFVILTSASVSFLLSACFGVDPRASGADQSVPNDQRIAGTGVVVGRAVTVGSDGAVHAADREKVFLIPKNSVIPRGHHMIFVVGAPVKVLDNPRYPEDAVRVLTDADGNFRFVHLAPGDYVVTAGVSYYHGEDVSVDANGSSQSTPHYDYVTISTAVTVRNGGTAKAENWRREE